MKNIAFPMLLAMFAAACSTVPQKTGGGNVRPPTATAAPVWQPDFSAGPPTIVYKTKKDFSDNVPVALSVDKKRMVSYPAPADLAPSKKPAPLVGGYLLDQRGIAPGTVYLKTSWAEWNAQKTAPSPAEMLGLVLEADPFFEMCDCGNRYQFKKNVVEEINSIIASGQLSKCKKLK